MSGTFTRPNMKTLRAGVLMPLVFLVLGCFQERWEGYVYPDKQDLTQHIFVGEYSTLESCRAGALAKLHGAWCKRERTCNSCAHAALGD